MTQTRFSLGRVLATVIAVGVPLLMLACWYSPIANLYSRLGVVIFGVAALMELLWLGWRFRFFRYALILIYAGGLIFYWLVPAAPQVNTAALRFAYVKSLGAYQGKHYLWGGEGVFGIDCSGLVRRGMEDALVWRGICTLDPGLLRKGVSLWWHDNTAQGIGAGYGGRTQVITQCQSLNDLNYDLLRPGDMATDAAHIMAYLGNGQWIAADPGEGKVVKFSIPETHNFYFSIPMKIVRWTVLEVSNDNIKH